MCLASRSSIATAAQPLVPLGELGGRQPWLWGSCSGAHLVVRGGEVCLGTRFLHSPDRKTSCSSRGARGDAAGWEEAVCKIFLVTCLLFVPVADLQVPRGELGGRQPGLMGACGSGHISSSHVTIGDCSHSRSRSRSKHHVLAMFLTVYVIVHEKGESFKRSSVVHLKSSSITTMVDVQEFQRKHTCTECHRRMLQDCFICELIFCLMSLDWVV